MEIKDWLSLRLGQDILTGKYLQPHETLDAFFDRVSGGNARFRQLLVEQKVMPAGRILSNRGVSRKGSISNCYVLVPPEDNIESIWECAMRAARTYSYGGGCGIDLGKLAPRGAGVNNEAKTSSGAVSFMELFATTTSIIGQNGRRGALMLSLPVEHPDIQEFIHAKEQDGVIKTANISVRVSDAFMEAVKNGDDWVMGFRRETGEAIRRSIPARQLFREIAESAWDNAEPGVLFWDTVCSHSYLSEDPEFQFAGTNPCGEQPLPAGGSCLLTSMNLAAYVQDPFSESPVFDLEAFRKDVTVVVGWLNDLLDEGLAKHPLQEQKDSVAKWRQIGLGIMGLGDALAMMKLRYGSVNAIGFCNSIARSMQMAALGESIRLGKKFGSYPAFDVDAIKCSKMLPEWYKGISAMRNSQILTCAPTGSISTMLGISGGIEPIFSVKGFSRKTESLHGKDVVYEDNSSYAVRLYHEMFPGQELPDYFVGAHDIPWRERLEMQAAWQKHIDAAISSTVNLPHDTTVEEVEQLYMEAWRLGLKGVTVYRDGCRRSGVLQENGKEKAAEETTSQVLQRGEVAPVPEGLLYRKHCLRTGCGKLYLFVGVDEQGHVHDVYTNTSGEGGCMVNTNAVSRGISIQLRAGVSIPEIAEQLERSGTCPSYQFARGAKKELSRGKSCASSIARVLMEYQKAAENQPQESRTEDTEEKKTSADPVAPVPEESQSESTGGRICPVCGQHMVEAGGCPTCRECGWSPCG